MRIVTRIALLGVLLLVAPTPAVTLAAPGPRSLAGADIYVSVGPSRHRFVTLAQRDGRPALKLTDVAVRRYAGKWIEWKCRDVTGRRTDGGGMPIRADADLIAVDPGDAYCVLQVKLRSVHRVQRKDAQEVGEGIDLAPPGLSKHFAQQAVTGSEVVDQHSIRGARGGGERPESVGKPVFERVVGARVEKPLPDLWLALPAHDRHLFT